MKKILLVIGVLILGLSALRCGYSTRSTLPHHLRTIHVESFANAVGFSTEAVRRNIYIPLLEVKVRKAVVNRFLVDGNLKIADPDRADLILRGELKDYDRAGLRFTDNDDVQEYRISITMSMEMFDTHSQKVIWQEPSFSGEAAYFVTGPQAKSEDAAIEDATVDLARRIVERTIEDW